MYLHPECIFKLRLFFNAFTVVESVKQFSLRELGCIFGWIVTNVTNTELWCCGLVCCLIFFFSPKPTNKTKKTDEENVLETIQEKDVLSKVAVFSWRSFCCCAGRGEIVASFLHVPCSLLPPVSSSFSLQCDPGLSERVELTHFENASSRCCGIEPVLALGRSFFPKRSLEARWRGCNGVMIAVLGVTWQWALIWIRLGAALASLIGAVRVVGPVWREGGGCSCFTLLGPALARAECVPVLVGMPGLGHFRGLGCFFWSLRVAVSKT